MKLSTKRLRSAHRGQAILLIALAMVAIAAFVGLMTDVGVLFIEYGKLKRGIDAGAIAAVQQFRNGFDPADLVSAARNFLTLNQTTADNINLFRCKQVLVSGVWVEDTAVDGTIHDPDLCPATPTAPRRKLVRVEADRWVDFAFLRVIGIPGTTIKASSVGEAASLDLVLIFDTSASMGFQTGGHPLYADHPNDDPAFCNDEANATPCQPLADIKSIAVDFVTSSQLLFFPYDRVAIVTITNQEPDAPFRDPVDIDGNPIPVLSLSDNQDQVVDAINNLRVFQPVVCNWGSPASPPKGTCRNLGEGDPPAGPFLGMGCPIRSRGANLIDDFGAPGSDDFTGDPTTCGTSNIGGALVRASQEFVREGFRRDESLWVVILLAGGPANATNPDEDGLLPDGFCPTNTWNDVTQPLCRGADVSAATRHSLTDADTTDDWLYDADDYARDMADELTDPSLGQSVTFYTIGLGDLVLHATRGDADAGQQLLQYIALNAGDCLDCDPPYRASHGTYHHAPNTEDLRDIFAAIAANIFTRIAQ